MPVSLERKGLPATPGLLQPTSSNAATDAELPPSVASARAPGYLVLVSDDFCRITITLGERGEPQCEGNMLRQLKNMLVPHVGTFFSYLEPAVGSTPPSWGEGLTCQEVRFIKPRMSSQRGNQNESRSS